MPIILEILLKKNVHPLKLSKTITLENVSFSYDKNTKDVIENINIQIPAQNLSSS